MYVSVINHIVTIVLYSSLYMDPLYTGKYINVTYNYKERSSVRIEWTVDRIFSDSSDSRLGIWLLDNGGIIVQGIIMMIMIETYYYVESFDYVIFYKM